jgi:hypothetical protein
MGYAVAGEAGHPYIGMLRKVLHSDDLLACLHCGGWWTDALRRVLMGQGNDIGIEAGEQISDISESIGQEFTDGGIGAQAATIVEGMVAVVRRSLVFVVAMGSMTLGRSGLALAQSGAPPVAVVEQVPVETKADDAARPLPDIPALLRAVQANQKASEAVAKDYLYRSVVTEEASDGHGGVKKTNTEEYDDFWLEGVQVRRLVKKNGKELTAGEQKKESERLDKEVARAKERRAKADEKGKETGARGEELVTVSRLMELGSFTNARREQLNGRDVIVVDFAGDPKAKTKSKFEEVIRDMAGTAWMDEQDKVMVKAQGHFINTFKVGAGLVVNIQKGTNFSMEQRKINDEVWLPAALEAQGSFRALLFVGFNGSVTITDSDYRKFKATSTILPGMSTVGAEPEPK